jgi:DNA-binding response OmpR family regulator
MKPMNGLDFLHKIRNATDTPNPFVPAIMLTAYTDLNRVLQSRDAGITEFLAKPFTPVTLYSRIVAVVEDQRAFVRSENFFGPDRRRVTRPFPGMDRRGDMSAMHVDASADAGADDSAWQI